MRLVVCGFGTVAQSLAKLLVSRSDDLYAKYGMMPRIVGVFDTKGGVIESSGLDLNKLVDIKKKYGTVDRYSTSKRKLSGLDIINSVDADVLIETTASNYKDAEPGMSHIIAAMKKGMHVITVNKGPLALAFPSLMELATYNHVLLRFSGTVGGGTPILDYAKNSLRGEQITSFAGILNGTTNYILTNMAKGMSFAAALKDAKSKGYVEADESLDLDGYDAAAKLVILANWVMGMKVTMPDIKRTGIRKVTTADIKNAARKKAAIKLIASCNKDLIVAPREIPVDDPLCVNGTLNAISFTSEHSGTQTIIGRGAGGTETASAILRDLLDIRQEISRD
ncbi:MAG: homoserine dehydrogenase [Candidatus Nitrosotenuis sp.]